MMKPSGIKSARRPGLVRLARVLPMVLAAAVLGGCYNFHTVKEDRLYRAAQPMKEDLTAMVRHHNIRTVFRLNGYSAGQFWYDEGAEAAKECGVNFVQIGISATRFPTRTELVMIWEVLETAEYPMLIHCREGADRTGLVAAMSVLCDGGSMAEARDQLRMIPYGHMAMFGTESIDHTLDMYEPWFGVLTFGEWAARYYEQPAKGSDPGPLVEAQKKLLAGHRKASGEEATSG